MRAVRGGGARDLDETQWWYASFKDATGRSQQAALGTADEKVAKRMLAALIAVSR